jgi:hypothetical protein
MTNKILIIFTFLAISFGAAAAGWVVDCNNHCFFSDIQPNCQGVYWKGDDGPFHKIYSSWNNNLKGCLATDAEAVASFLIKPSQISCNCATPTSYPPADKSAPLTAATREKLEILRAQVHGWTPCAPDPAGTYPDIFKPIGYKNINTCQFFRKRDLPRLYIHAEGCYNGLNGWVSDWPGCNYNGDQLAETNALCLSGDKDACDQIKDAQDPITGAWYRNSFMRRHPVTTHFQPAFSRDQMLGMLSYFIVSKDKAAATKWLQFVKNNGTAPWGAGVRLKNLCPPRANVPKPDNISQEHWDKQLAGDSCAIVPDAWGIIYYVLIHMGFSARELSSIDRELYELMVAGKMGMDSSINIVAATVPWANYQMGRAFDAAHQRLLTGGGSSIRAALSTMNERTSKLNPLYHVIAEGKPTEYGAYLVRKYCTAGRPNWGFWFANGFARENNNSGYWMLGRSYAYTNYNYAGGHGKYGEPILPTGDDCLTFLNYYLGNGNYTELECDAGDQLINGACRRVALNRPYVAPINGMDYKIDPSNGNLNYIATDMNKCLYGGTLVDWAVRCFLPSGMQPHQFLHGVNYWVDPTIGRAGIYYATVRGICSHGGTLINGACRVHSYNIPTIRQGVRYWVDPNPSWPGIYYARVNGSCPYGGSLSGTTNCLLMSFSSGVLKSGVPYFPRANYSTPGVYYYPRVVPEKKILTTSSTQKSL